MFKCLAICTISVIVHVLYLSPQLLHLLLFISVGQLPENLISRFLDPIDEIIVVVTADSLGEHHVHFVQCLPLGVYGAKSGVLQKTN